MKRSALCVLLLAPLCFGAEVPSQPIASKGKMLFEDDFDGRTTLGDWKQVVPTFKVENGSLIGVHTREDHGAVGRRYIDCTDVIFECRFKFEGASINVVFDDKNHKGSHAGHIARVVLAPTAVRIGDDKEGAMKLEIYEARKNADAAAKKKIDQSIAGRAAAFPNKLQQNRWYQLHLELIGDQLLVAIDGKNVAFLQSPGIAHPTKTSVHFTVSAVGKQAQIDDVKMWEAKPTGIR